MLSGLSAHVNDDPVSFAHDLRAEWRVLVVDAIRQIRANLRQRIVRIEPLCEQLGVCRSHLHHVFVRAGLVSVSDFIKREQLAMALRLLRGTNKPISQIAHETGFLTATHFATFVKRLTGKPPRSLRND